MRLFGKKKPRKLQLQQQDSGELEARTDGEVTRGHSRERSQKSPLNSSLTNGRSRSQSSTRSQSSSRSSRSTEPTNIAIAKQSSKPSPNPNAKAKSPTSILQKDAHFGASPRPPPTTYHMHEDNFRSRVRFMSSGESVTSQSEASAVHLMSCAGSSSAMSSSGVLNKVMEDEYRRLNAMGMHPVPPNQIQAKPPEFKREDEEHKRLSAMGMSLAEPKSSGRRQ